MATVQDEVEAKYDVGDDVVLPPVTELFAAARGDGDAGPEARVALVVPWSGDVVEERLGAVYLDTAGLDLLRARLTLRRRTGGHDEGWHLKVPAGAHRREVRLPLDASGAHDDAPVPDELVALTWAATLGRPLAPVVRIDTVRTLHRLLDPTGAVLAEVADDRVEARRVLAVEGSGRALGAVQAWREVEVELVDGPPALLAAADAALRALGLTPAAGPSKLGRALGRDATGERADDPDPAGTPVRAHLAEQVAVLRAHDLPVRLDAPDAVHAMRVAARRVRSALRTFGSVLDAPALDAPALDAPPLVDLRRLGRVLGEARDAEVLRDRVAAALSAEPPDVRGGEVAAEPVERLERAYREAHAAVVAALDADWYRALLTALVALTTTPAGRAAGTGSGDARPDEPPDRPAEPGAALLEAVADADARVRRAARRAARAAEAGDDVLLRRRHALRKAARRARYVAEVVAPAVGEDARRYAAAMEALQDALGEHLDGLAVRRRVRDLADSTGRPATAFALGRLHALEDARAGTTWSAAEGALAAARRGRVRRWLR